MKAIRKEASATLDFASPEPKALTAIERALEAHYADLVQAPLPQRLVELLARLDVEDGASEAQGSGDANG